MHRKRKKIARPKTAYQKKIFFLAAFIGGLLLLLLVGLLLLMNHPFHLPPTTLPGN